MSKTILLVIPLFFPEVVEVSNWTMACYMAADNDLAPWCMTDLEELMTIGSCEDITIIAQVDWHDSGAKRYLVRPGSLEVLSDLGEINSGDPWQLAEFASWSFLQFPATHFLLVIWDHGSGWTKGQTGMKGICYDRNPKDFISISQGELSLAMKQIKSLLGRKIDIVAFDACLMQMVEVLSELKDEVDFAVGSEYLVPVQGFPYDSILSKVVARPSILPQELADSIVTQYINCYTQALWEVALSRVDLSIMEELMAASQEFASILQANATHPLVGYARKNTQTVQNYPPTPEDDHIDYYHFAELLSDSSLSSMAVCAEKILDLIDSSTFSRSYGDLLQNTHGIAIWFPDNYSTFISGAYDYRNLNFAAATKWEKAIYPYYQVVDTIPPTIPQINPVEIDELNSYDLTWEPSYDLSSVENYGLIEVTGLGNSFWDDAESDSDKWEMDGFSISTGNPHTGSCSYFSSSGEFVTRNPIEVSAEGRLSFWCSHRMRKNKDFLWVQFSSDGREWVVVDSLTGIELDWKEIKMNIGVEVLYLGFRFRSDGTPEHWVYIDDIRVDSISSLDTISVTLTSTNHHFFHKHRDTYYYQLRACDEFGNLSEWSDFAVVDIVHPFLPFNYPNPFQNSTKIIFDSPSESHTIVIYNLAGQRIRTLRSEIGRHEVYWNGRDDSGARVASGVYFCMVGGTNFHRSGKLILLK